MGRRIQALFIDDKVIFIHNPRAAGTATRRALCMGEDPNLNIPFPGNKISRTSSNQKHSFARMVRHAIPRDEWDRKFKFAIVRNPFERLVSLYGLFRKPHSGIDDAKTDHKIEKFRVAFGGLDRDMDKKTLKKFYNKALSLDFKTWVHFCDRHCWNGCAYLGRNRSLIRIQQHEWFDGLDRVFRFEELYKVSDFLLGQGYDCLERENQSSHRQWESYYDDETYRFVADIYRDDIEMFGYG